MTSSNVIFTVDQFWASTEFEQYREDHVAGEINLAVGYNDDFTISLQTYLEADASNPSMNFEYKHTYSRTDGTVDYVIDDGIVLPDGEDSWRIDANAQI